jgi:hypothetical protein
MTSPSLRSVAPALVCSRALRFRLALVACLLWLLPIAAQAQGPTPQQGPNFGSWSLGEVAIGLEANGGGGAGDYAWDVIGGALPPGVSLRTDVNAFPSYLSPNAKAALLGVATVPGTYNFSLRVSRGGTSTTQNATLRVAALTMTRASRLPPAYIGVAYSQQLTAANAVGPVTWALNGSVLPNGLSLSAAGLISGIPTVTSGTSINLRMTDATGVSFGWVGLDVYAIRVTSPDVLPNAPQAQPYATTITAAGGTPPYTFTLANNNTLPTGLTLNPATGQITGTTTAGRGGWAFTVAVTDSVGRALFKPMTIDVIRQPQGAPRFALYSNFSDDCTLGWPCERAIAALSGGTAPFTWTISGQPPGMSVTLRDWISPRDMLIGGTPTVAGDYDVEVTVTDAVGQSTTNVFPMHVSKLLQRFDSTRRLDLVDGRLDVPYSRVVAVTGGAPPYSVAMVSGALPPGLTFNAATRTVSGTPEASGSFTAVFVFTDSVGNTLRVNDGLFIDASVAGGGNGTIDITAGYNLGTVTTGSSVSRTFSACCVPSYLWTAVDPLPPGLSLSPDGVLSGVAAANGTYDFVIKAADAQFPANYALQRFVLIVAPAAQSPIQITTSSLPPGNVGTFYNRQIVVSGGVGQITFSLFPVDPLPPGLALSGDGTLSGTPTHTGQFVFSVVMTDGSQSATAFYTLFVYAAGVTPPLDLSNGPSLGTFALGQQTINLSATGGVAPYTYSLTPGSPAIPGMRIQSGPPLPSGSTATGAFLGVLTTPGNYTTSIRVVDSVGTVLDRLVTMSVLPLHELSQTVLPRGAVGTPYSFTVEPYGGTGPYAWSATGLPPGLSIDSTGQVVGIPTVAGTYFPRFILKDLPSDLSINPTSYTLVIDSFPISTSGALPPGKVGTFFTQALLSPQCLNCVWSITGTLPGGLSLVGNTISGTPTASTSGTSFTIRATGTNGSAQKLFAIQIAPSTAQPLSITTTSPLGDRTLAVSTANVLFAQGGTLPYTWSIDSGTLPTGMHLTTAAEGLGANLSPGFAYLAGRPMTVGSFTFTLRVTDAVGAFATRTFTWNVSALNYGYFTLPITNSTLVFGQPYSQTLLGYGGTTGAYTWTATGPLPTGLTLAPNTGLVSGTPGVTGSVSVPIRLTDNAGGIFTGSLTFNINSPTGTALSFGQAANIGTLQQGAAFSRNLSISGGTPPYTVSAVTPLPPGFELLSGDELPSGAPAGSWFLAGTPLAPGTFTFTLQAVDTVGNVGARTFTIAFAPFWLGTSTALADGSVGVAYSQALFNSGSVVWSAVSGMPPGLTVSPAGVISGTPSQAGTFTASIMSTEVSTGLALIFAFPIRISNLAIGGSSVLPPATFGLPYTHTFTATGGTGALVWTATGLPAGVTLSSDGTLSGTPAATQGTQNVVVTVTDGVSTVSRRVTIFVGTSNPQVLSIGNTSPSDATLGQGYTLILSPAGGVPGYTWSVAPGSTLPAGLQLVSGALLPQTFAPGSTLLAGVPTVAGDFSFGLVVTDSAGTQLRRTFTLKVSPISLASTSLRTAVMGVAYAQRFTAVGGTAPYTFSMTLNSAAAEMLPPGLALSADGLISGTPGSTGTYQFLLRIQDSAGHSLSRSFGFTVTNAANQFVGQLGLSETSIGTGRQQSLSVSGSSSTYAWSIAAGALPAGMTLNGSLVSGRPAAVGTFVYTVRATNVADATNTVDRVYTLKVAPTQVVAPAIELNEQDLPPATVGVLYSATIKAAGGAPPYTFTVTPTPLNTLPPGLTLSAGGVLSGTPQSIGAYLLAVTVTDATGKSHGGTTVSVSVNPAGKASPLFSKSSSNLLLASLGAPVPAIALDSRIRGGVAPFAWSVAPGSSLPPGIELAPGGNGVSARLAGIPTAAGTFEFSVVVNDSSGQTLTLPVTASIVNIAVTPTRVPMGRVGVAYSVPLVPSGGAAPYVIALQGGSDLPPGLTLAPNGLLSGTPTHAGNFGLNVIVTDANATQLLITIPLTIDNAAGEAPAVEVAPKPVQVYFVQGLSSAAPVPVSVTSTSGVRPFTAFVTGVPGATLSAANGNSPASLNLDLHLGSLAIGSYHGSLGVAMPGTENRTDFVDVIVTVTAPPPCVYSVNPLAGSIAAGGGAGGFNVDTQAHCTWTAVPSAPWISITNGASGTGAGPVGYSLLPNPAAAQRSGSIDVNGELFSITQFGSGCSFAINPPSISAPALGGAAFVNIAASDASCSWSSSSTDLVVNPASGTGSVGVMVLVPTSTLAASRQLTATIAGQTFAVTQSGIDCTVSLSPYDAVVAAAGGDGSVGVTVAAGCQYDTTLGPNWISVTSGASGTGSGTLVYKVAPNSSTVARSGSITIGGQAFQVTQDAAACTVTINTASLGSPFGSVGGNGSIGITTNGPNCAWTASSQAPWATANPPAGTGNRNVTVSLGSNAGSAVSRSTNLVVNGQLVPILQAGTVCSYGLQSPSGAVPAVGGSGSVGVVAAPVCGWSSTSDTPAWLSITASGNSGTGEVRFSALPNLSDTPRQGSLTIAGIAYVVTQPTPTCTVTLPASTLQVAAGGASSSFTFSAIGTACSPALSFANWITTQTQLGAGGGTVSFDVAPTPFTAKRAGTIQIGDKTFTITQSGGQCSYSLASYGALFTKAGGDGSIFGSPTAVGCTPVVGTTEPLMITLGTLTGPLANIFRQDYAVAPFNALTPTIRIGKVSFGGQAFTVKQPSW